MTLPVPTPKFTLQLHITHTYLLTLGVAPFRFFWQARKQLNAPRSAAFCYFGCRDTSENFFAEEAKKSVNWKVALSREPGESKMYVQDLLLRDKMVVYDVMANRGGHLYTCGKVTIHNCNYC